MKISVLKGLGLLVGVCAGAWSPARAESSQERVKDGVALIYREGASRAAVEANIRSSCETFGWSLAGTPEFVVPRIAEGVAYIGVRAYGVQLCASAPAAAEGVRLVRGEASKQFTGSAVQRALNAAGDLCPSGIFVASKIIEDTTSGGTWGKIVAVAACVAREPEQ